MKTLYALIVGINNYPNPAHQLNGCTEDAAQFAQYLANYAMQNGWEYAEKKLIDSEATRQSIVNGFTHFSAAKNGDVCVFFYAGHGSQVPAPPEYWNENDGKLETLVCYDSRTGAADARDLVDKELGYLIYQATTGKDIHFLMVADCCHSGSNTRDLSIKSRMADPDTRAPRAADFVGYSNYKKGMPPAAKYVHLAAAKDSETAKEYKIEGTSRGVFTFSLLETLGQVGGNISYNEFVERVSLKVRNRVKEQQPLLSGDTALIKNGFLSGKAEIGNFLAYKSPTEGWCVNAGGVQGIPTEGAVFRFNDGILAGTKQVFANYSTIETPQTMLKGEQLRVQLHRLNSGQAQLPVVRLGFEANIEGVGRSVIEQLWQLIEPKNVTLVADGDAADYIIRTRNSAYRLTSPDSEIPMFRQVKGFTEEGGQQFIADIQAIANWQKRLEWDNALTSIRESDFEMVVLNDYNQPLQKPYIFKQPSSNDYAYVQIGIKNRSSRNYWISAVAFGADFGITNGFLREKELAPNEIAWLEIGNERILGLNVNPDFKQKWGVYQITEYIKFIVSTDKISTDSYNQDALPFDTNAGGYRAISAGNRGINISDWRSFLLQYKVLAPIESVRVIANEVNTLGAGAIAIETPAGFSAKASLNATSDILRGVSSAKTQSAERGILPENKAILDNTERLDKKMANGFSKKRLVEGFGESEDLDMIELTDVLGKETITAQNPMRIKLQDKITNELILPCTFDTTTGLYLPIGHTAENGDILLETLPNAEDLGSEGEMNSRSLMGSLKIFFKKMVIQPLTGEFEYPLLRGVEFLEGENYNYIDDTATIKNKIATAQNVCLFIHGIIGDTEDMVRSVKRLQDENGNSVAPNFDYLLAFDYESLSTSIEHTAADLKDRLAAVGIAADTPHNLTIIAHSMGGLVSRFFIEKLEGNKIVSKLIMLGTPNGGSEISDVRKLVTQFLTVAINGAVWLKPLVAPLSIMSNYVGGKVFKTLDLMSPKSDFLEELNALPDAGVPYCLVAGNTELLKVTHPEEYNFLQKVVNNLKERGIYTALDLLVFEKANDMAVRTNAIRTTGKQTKISSIEVPSDHISYFIKPESLAALRQYLV